MDGPKGMRGGGSGGRCTAGAGCVLLAGRGGHFMSVDCMVLIHSTTRSCYRYSYLQVVGQCVEQVVGQGVGRAAPRAAAFTLTKPVAALLDCAKASAYEYESLTPNLRSTHT